VLNLSLSPPSLSLSHTHKHIEEERVSGVVVLNLSLSPLLSLSLSLSLSHTHKHTHTHTHTQRKNVFLVSLPSHTHTLSLSHSLCLTHTHMYLLTCREYPQETHFTWITNLWCSSASEHTHISPVTPYNHPPLSLCTFSSHVTINHPFHTTCQIRYQSTSFPSSLHTLALKPKYQYLRTYKRKYQYKPYLRLLPIVYSYFVPILTIILKKHGVKGEYLMLNQKPIFAVKCWLSKLSLRMLHSIIRLAYFMNMR
jgi:hypothetical protein